MSSRKQSKTTKTVVIPLRLPRDMHQQIRTLSAKTNLTDAAIMRLAIERGLANVETMFAKPTTKAA